VGADASAAPQPIRVFVSYSHRDAEYVKETADQSLLGYLRPTLERDGFAFWWDENLVAGTYWNDEIAKEMKAADIALVLVSQNFLNSKYCTEVEVEALLAARKASGLVVFPVIVSSCDWASHAWLAATQFEPRAGQSLATHYTERGPRDGLYLSIMNQLREIGRRLREGRTPSSSDPRPGRPNIRLVN
jgi:hypothetical protein